MMFENLVDYNKPGLSLSDFNYFRSKIKTLAGIHLSDVKKELVASRIRSHLKVTGCRDFNDYRMRLESLSTDDSEWQLFINLLTTNKTDFFREAKHFEFLQEEIIPSWFKNKDDCFKVWSAASSTGEEAYTLAMTLNESLSGVADYKVFGSDIDTKVIAKAKNAVYPVSKLEDIPEKFHKNTFDFGTKEISGWMRIKIHLLRNVNFAQHNLVDENYLFANEFDLILCRNVMIYFNSQTIKLILKKLYVAAKPGAILFIGHSESLQNIDSGWTYLAPSIYIKAYGK